MSEWSTVKQMSEKYGIDESSFHEWSKSGCITCFTMGDERMLDDESFIRYLNEHQVNGLDDEALIQSVKEKELQREMKLSRLEDEVFLLQTHSRYPSLFPILIQELGACILDKCQRGIFLAIAGGEPLSRVAQRYGLSYDETRRTYESIFNKLGGEAAQIPLFFRFLMTRFKKPAGWSGNPMDIPLEKVIPPRAARILEAEKNITTVYELLQFASTCGWPDLLRLKGMGRGTFNSILQSMEDAHYITCKDRKRDMSPEISIFVQ